MKNTSSSLNREACAEMLASPDTFALVLLIIAEVELGLDALYGSEDEDPLDSVTLYHELERRFQVSLPTTVENRLQAAITLRTTSAFEDTIPGFIAITLALTEGQLGDMVTGGLEEPDVDECIWASYEASCIDPELKPMSRDVALFLQTLEANEKADPDEQDAGEGEDMVEQLHDLTSQLRKIGLPDEQIAELCSRGEAALSDG